jgi:predicted molibdopterin-dependent oxidoreductase YjgC
MLSGAATPISSQYHQINVGGDKAALMGVCKALLEIDDVERTRGNDGVLDRDFIAQHTQGFDEFEACVRGHGWPELEIGSGLKRAAMEAVAAVYAHARAAIVGYGMGLTQHVNGVENVQMVVNLLLSRARAYSPSAATRTSRVSAPSASPKSRSSCPTTSSRSYTASSRRARRGSIARKLPRR